MERDWLRVITALRTKAADPAVTPEESKLLSDKADELEKKYNLVGKQSPHSFTIYLPREAPTVVIRKDENNFGAWLVDIDEGEGWQTGHYQFPGEEGTDYG